MLALRLNIREDDVHDESSPDLYHEELQNILFAPVCKVFSLLPVAQLVRFLTIVEWEKMRDLFLMSYHD